LTDGRIAKPMTKKLSIYESQDLKDLEKNMAKLPSKSQKIEHLSNTWRSCKYSRKAWPNCQTNYQQN
jgi:hypothetical protein